MTEDGQLVAIDPDEVEEHGGSGGGIGMNERMDRLQHNLQKEAATARRER